MARSTRGSENASISVIAHHLLPHVVGLAHSGLIGDMRGGPAFFGDPFAVLAPVDQDRHERIAAGADLDPVPAFGVVGTAESEGALEMFVDPQPSPVDALGSAVHADRDVPDFGLIDTDRDQHAEK